LAPLWLNNRSCSAPTSLYNSIIDFDILLINQSITLYGPNFFKPMVLISEVHNPKTTSINWAAELQRTAAHPGSQELVPKRKVVLARANQQ
jgi:hypothetical protein